VATLPLEQRGWVTPRIVARETEEERHRLMTDLHAFGFNAGVVRVRDKYGDYGIAEFFMTLATLHEYRLEHFVFSCRIMNMGVEQYIFEYLNKPKPARPVLQSLCPRSTELRASNRPDSRSMRDHVPRRLL
jgi:hypothetical protein